MENKKKLQAKLDEIGPKKIQEYKELVIKKTEEGLRRREEKMKNKKERRGKRRQDTTASSGTEETNVEESAKTKRWKKEKQSRITNHCYFISDNDILLTSDY